MTKTTTLGVALLLALALPTLRAEREGPSADPQAARFKTGVDLVEVTVSVRDRNGRFVSDLTQRDFEVSEQGAPQAIVAFEHVSTPALPISPTTLRSAAADVASNQQAGGARVFALVLDAHHVAPQRTTALRKYARDFIEGHVGPADFAAVLSPGAIAGATQDFTTDKAKLVAAVDQFVGTRLRSATIEREEEARRAIDQSSILHGGRDPSDGERAIRAMALADVLEAVARDLDPMRGRRKTVLVFTEGIDYNVFDALGAHQRYGSDVRRALERAIGALMRTNAVVYSVDPRGLTSPDEERLEAPMYSQPAGANSVLNPGLEGEFAASVISLRSLAEPTGGFAVVNTNDFPGAFDRIENESGEYYVLGYTPSRPPKPGEFREISVRVSRPDVKVVARKGYVLPGDVNRVSRQPEPSIWLPGPQGQRGPRNAPRTISLPAEPQRPAAVPSGVTPELAFLLTTPLPRAGLPLRVQATPFKGDGRKASVQIVVEILGRALQLTERSGRYEEHIDLALVTVDGRAHVDNGKSTRIDLRLTPEEAERVTRTGVRWVSKLSLAPGRYQLRVAGSARSATPGAVTCEVDVPSFGDARLAISGISLTSLTSVLMVTRGDARLAAALGTPPSLDRAFVKGDVARAGLEIYLPGSLSGDVEVSARVERSGGLAPLDAGTRTVSGRGQPRTEAVVFPLNTAALAPGQYVLRVSVNGGGADRLDRSLPFEVLPMPATVR